MLLPIRFAAPAVLWAHVNHQFCHRRLFKSYRGQGVSDYFAQLPVVDNPEIFGMHENANVTFNTNESVGLMQTASAPNVPSFPRVPPQRIYFADKYAFASWLLTSMSCIKSSAQRVVCVSCGVKSGAVNHLVGIFCSEVAPLGVCDHGVRCSPASHCYQFPHMSCTTQQQ